MRAVFALGSNGSGQLGISHREDVSVPKPADLPADLQAAKIAAVAAGGNHTLILTEAGELFWSGDGSSGACGRLGESGAVATAFQPVDLGPNGPSRISMIAATWEASIIGERDDSGHVTRVYSLGTGMKGELGQGELIVKTPVAGLIAHFPPAGANVVSLSACMGHVVVLLSNGDVYGWGNGRKGQLGLPEGVVYAPRNIADVSFPVARAVCGREFTCLVGDPENGNILVLGSDKWGLRSAAPKAMPGWRDVQASWSNVFILDRNGIVRSWGRDDHGQMTPPGLTTVAQIAAGSEHVLALTQNGDAIAWGWGEHGNCGPLTEQGDVKGRWNVIASAKYMPPDTIISAVAAGCATSWVILSDIAT
jgi:protein ATS1